MTTTREAASGSSAAADRQQYCAQHASRSGAPCRSSRYTPAARTFIPCTAAIVCASELCWEWATVSLWRSAVNLLAAGVESGVCVWVHETRSQDGRGTYGPTQPGKCTSRSTSSRAEDDFPGERMIIVSSRAPAQSVVRGTSGCTSCGMLMSRHTHFDAIEPLFACSQWTAKYRPVPGRVTGQGVFRKPAYTCSTLAMD